MVVTVTVPSAVWTRRIGTERTKDLYEIAALESRAMAAAVNGEVGVEIFRPILDQRQIESVVNGSLINGAQSRDWWSRQANGVSRSFEQQMKMGVLQGETLDQLTKRVRSTGGIPGVSDQTVMKTARRIPMSARWKSVHALTRC